MLEGVGWEGQVQVEYLAEQGLDLSKESGGLGSRKLSFLCKSFEKTTKYMKRRSQHSRTYLNSIRIS